MNKRTKKKLPLPVSSPTLGPGPGGDEGDDEIVVPKAAKAAAEDPASSWVTGVLDEDIMAGVDLGEDDDFDGDDDAEEDYDQGEKSGVVPPYGSVSAALPRVVVAVIAGAAAAAAATFVLVVATEIGGAGHRPDGVMVVVVL